MSKFWRSGTKARQAPRIESLMDRRHDELLYVQGQILSQLLPTRRGERLSDFEFKVFSQWGEDGIIQKLIQHLEIPNRSFVEFGVENFREANCRFLLMHNNWRGLVIDGDERHVESIRGSAMSWRHHLESRCAFIRADTIDSLIESAGFGADLGLLSVDIDGVDWWILDAIKCCNPRILIVEYNSVFGAERAITVPYDPAFRRGEQHYSHLYYGASLAAFHHLASGRGYALIGTNSAGSNAFFVRRDQLAQIPFPELNVAQAFVESVVRESRDLEGRLDFRAGADRLAVIRGLPVINVVSRAPETL